MGLNQSDSKLMPKETSTADFLNNITNDKEIFEEKSEPIEDVIEEEERLPFHKDPKIQRFVDKQIAKALEKIPKSAEQTFRQEVREETGLPPALVKLVGDDTPEKREALKEFADYMESLPKKAQEQFLERQNEQARQIAQEDDDALNELNAGFEEIEETFGVDLSSNTIRAQEVRSSFVEYLRKISHKNEEGEVDQFADIPAAWEDFQERSRPQQANRAKQLASRGLTRSTDTSSGIPQGKSWKDVDKFFENLKRTN